MFNISNTRVWCFFVLVVASVIYSSISYARQAPDFSLPDLRTGSLTRLSDMKGQVIYLEFWASWCKPCRSGLPALNRIMDEINPTGFKIIGINVAEQREAGIAFLDKYPVNFINLRDADGKVAEMYHVEAMPYGYLIDRQGSVVEVISGFREDDEKILKRKILKLMAR